MAEESVTILKYKLDGKFCFHVMDKFDETDEPVRLDKMMSYSADLEAIYGTGYQELWIKTCPIFATK